MSRKRFGDEVCYEGSTYFNGEHVVSTRLGTFGSGSVGRLSWNDPDEMANFTTDDAFIQALSEAYDTGRAPSSIEVMKNDPTLHKRKDDVIFSVCGEENPYSESYYEEVTYYGFLTSLLFTSKAIPCGAIEEYDEIISAIEREYGADFSKDFYTINMLGHGAIVMANDINRFEAIQYIERELPEYIEDKLRLSFRRWDCYAILASRRP